MSQAIKNVSESTLVVKQVMLAIRSFDLVTAVCLRISRSMLRIEIQVDLISKILSYEL